MAPARPCLPSLARTATWRHHLRQEPDAVASAVLYSLIETAKANGLEPYRYLSTLFTRLPHARSEDDQRTLLLQHIALAGLLALS